MALVPVYEDAVKTSSGLALVRISPNVIRSYLGSDLATGD